MTDEETPLFRPRIQRWQELFRWEEEQTTLIGLTSVGRATLICLDLNSALRLAARAFWVAAGLFR